MSEQNLIPDIIDIRKMTTATCAMAFEELNEAVRTIELTTSEMNKRQLELWTRLKVSLVDFSRDMLLAEAHHEEIDRRLGLKL
ncbi:MULTISPECIES: hypothetical protein [Pseudomonas]|uniref:hypothetical protein n=1 Tax=Pseudomonas TaxID=286 RepID=UPI0004D711FF|nr:MULTISPECIES: hypothetical protein [Pseudomonas]MDF3866222.1 hypothetical protein [Pseudomonas denitrificans (nom. rej.)]KES20112.1 hypothetical protein FG99_01155 [Pseudomonas sp. AAC]MDU4255680.1 hypothetical protein [Pseudomonas sp.]NMZ77437.1 hypothetical protein [Pseudomonas nitroreducens]NNN26155.1 hypothetical protein [Pseudomonas nitroreducens]